MVHILYTWWSVVDTKGEGREGEWDARATRQLSESHGRLDIGLHLFPSQPMVQ